MSYTSRLIKFDRNLGFFCLKGDHIWGIWVFIQNEWIKVVVTNENAEAHEWWDYQNNELSFFRGNRIKYVILIHRCHEVFSFCSDFNTVTMPSRNM